MDAFDFDNLQTGKADALLRYRRLQNVAKLFRLLELCAALIFLSWTSSRIPFLVTIAGEYLRQLKLIILSPLFIFLLGNLIVLTLLAKSGQLTGQSSAVIKSGTNLQREFTKNIENRTNLEPHSVPEPEETVYQDKQIICEVKTVTSPPYYNINELTLVTDQKVLRRSQLETWNTENSEKPCGKLRLSETEMCRDFASSGGSSVELVDELSNKEFQRTIEAFIAKQLRFYKEKC